MLAFACAGMASRRALDTIARALNTIARALNTLARILETIDALGGLRESINNIESSRQEF